MRKTIVNQRKIMEQLQQQFAEALIGKKEEELPSTAFDMEASQERQQQLEDEVRRLRRENGTLKTSLLSSQEEAQARATEAQELLVQASDLKSELDVICHRHSDEIKAVRQQVQELQEANQRQREDLRRKAARLQEVEGLAGRWESEAKEAMKAINSEKERSDELHKQETKTRHELEDTGVALQEGKNTWRAEQERLMQELRNKDREVAKLKEVLATHAPKEEVLKWKSRCEDLHAQVDQANRANRKMQSAVGHMSSAASAQGGDLQELKLRNQYLLQEYEKQAAELKKMDLEKRDLKDQKENVEISLNYFQGKYQATAKDFKLLKEQSNEYIQGLAAAQKQIRELQAQLQQKVQVNGSNQADGRAGAYPVSQASLPSRPPSIQEKSPNQEIGRQSLLTQLDQSGTFRS